MAINRTGTWSLGRSVLWHSPNYTLDNTWSLGNSKLVDLYVTIVSVNDSGTSVAVLLQNRNIGLTDEGVGADVVGDIMSAPIIYLFSSITKITKITSIFLIEVNLASSMTKTIRVISRIF